MLRIAMKMAERVNHQYAHGVVVERGGAILATGYNLPHTHAEVKALRKLWASERKGVTVWSIRVTPGGRLAMAKPCPDCHRFLKESGVKTVMFSNENGQIERMRL